MKPRKTKAVKKVLKKKGFILNPEKGNHHQFYVLEIDGIKQNVKTYFSHGKSEIPRPIMGLIKKQLKFSETAKAEDFFDCPLTKEMYIQMLRDEEIISSDKS
jgi:predicted RNA binding protein YcfA (HicA-like mRNA interferase family)